MLSCYDDRVYSYSIRILPFESRPAANRTFSKRASRAPRHCKHFTSRTHKFETSTVRPLIDRNTTKIDYGIHEYRCSRHVVTDTGRQDNDEIVFWRQLESSYKYHTTSGRSLWWATFDSRVTQTRRADEEHRHPDWQKTVFFLLSARNALLNLISSSHDVWRVHTVYSAMSPRKLVG